ncbi:hypothetical protein BGAL_0056g00370 [Botrytis galanthina]|uniref:Uncharacterized protein n=1 Tax=Botrytis galanthina TaxID=278940 RepID=A0A4S8RFF4_9HELO|nr:hypothetical protein BGAL_0056g00370 [Botrytis galanthina]
MAPHPLISLPRLPYLKKISELAKEDPRYSAITFELLAIGRDLRDGGWAIINDLSSDAGVLPESSKFTLNTEHSKSSFNSKLKNISPETHTRVILFLTCDVSVSERHYRELYRPQIFHPAKVEILGSLYNVLPSFFYHILDPKKAIQKTVPHGPREGKLVELNNIQNSDLNILQMVIYYQKLLFRGADKSRGLPKTAEEFLHTITRLWDGMTNSEVKSAVQNPLELFVPVIADMADYFSRDLDHMDCSLQSWISNLDHNSPAVSRAHLDDVLLKAWHNGRGSLESFEKITSRIEDYQDQMIAQGVIEYGHNDNQKIKNMLRQQRKSLQEAYRLEQHVRDTLQMNV